MKLILILAALFCTAPASLPVSLSPVSGCTPIGQGQRIDVRAGADCPERADARNSYASEPKSGSSTALNAAISSVSARISVVDKPIPSNFDTATLIRGGIPRANSGKPEEVGAFRFICAPGQLNWDDPIIYANQQGRSPHLHQWFGNLSGRHDSDYASLRGAGDSTCSNKLNRSAYWIPAMFNAAGKVIRPDYISIYYKRRPLNDPLCFKQAKKGCVALPFNLRAVSGYDMNKPDNSENQTFYHRCMSPGKSGTHRATLAEAIADCGGAGQIASAIAFGDCWSGQLDSADHRSHLTHGSFGSWGYLKCPPTHPYLIPMLSQGVTYTIEPSDGEVYFSSDRMVGMPAKTPGTTFHADYMPAWDPETQAKWERECIDKLLTCADGNLGDGTIMKRGPLPSVAKPRLINPPVR